MSSHHHVRCFLIVATLLFLSMAFFCEIFHIVSMYLYSASHFVNDVIRKRIMETVSMLKVVVLCISHNNDRNNNIHYKS